MRGRGFGFLFLGIGLLVAGITWSIAIVGLVERSDWVQTEGVVVDVFESRDRESGNRMYSPEVAFGVGAETLTCESNARTSSEPDLGGTVTLSYDPDDPSECHLNSNNWVPWLLLGMGAIFLLAFGGVGIFMLRGRMTMHRVRSRSGRGGGFSSFSGPSSHRSYSSRGGPAGDGAWTGDQSSSETDDLRSDIARLRAELDSAVDRLEASAGEPPPGWSPPHGGQNYPNYPGSTPGPNTGGGDDSRWG